MKFQFTFRVSQDGTQEEKFVPLPSVDITDETISACSAVARGGNLILFEVPSKIATFAPYLRAHGGLRVAVAYALREYLT